MSHNNSQYNNRKKKNASQNPKDAFSANNKAYSYKQSNVHSGIITNRANQGHSTNFPAAEKHFSSYTSEKHYGHNKNYRESVTNMSRSHSRSMKGYNNIPDSNKPHRNSNYSCAENQGNKSPYSRRSSNYNYHVKNNYIKHSPDSSNANNRSTCYRPQKSRFKRNLILLIIAVIFVFGLASLISVSTLKNSADNLKTQLKTAISMAKDMDADGLYESIESIDNISNKMRKGLNSPIWSVISIIPVYGTDVETAGELLDVVDDVSDKLLKPLAEEIKTNPLSEMKVYGGFDIRLISSYFNLLDDVMPDIKSISERIDGISLKTKPGFVEEYAGTMHSAIDLINSLEPYLNLLRTILTPDEDRLYLLVAQNSAEIRASDGFPGSIGLIRIQNGILTIGDFCSVYDVFESDEMCTYEVTDQEVNLFSDQFAAWAHDACYNPDFSRVGEIWADSYELKNKEKVDGIISLTPAIIQELLSCCGSVTLSDGTVLDGTNASKVLQHDLYYTYLRDDETASSGNDIADDLFAETAEKVMSLATSNLGTKTLMGYVDILLQGADDRTVLIWMRKSDEEEIAEECGYSGKLNTDPDNPVAGIYINFADPCKLGWFLDINTELSTPATRADGRLEYEVTVKFTNTISGDDLNAGEYIVGSFGGSMLTYMYFFAPAGGIIYDFDDSDIRIEESEYNGLALGFRKDVCLDPGETITVKYKIITKAGVTTPLCLENTPTLQKYRYNQTGSGNND